MEQPMVTLLYQDDGKTMFQEIRARELLREEKQSGLGKFGSAWTSIGEFSIPTKTDKVWEQMNDSAICEMFFEYLNSPNYENSNTKNTVRDFVKTHKEIYKKSSRVRHTSMSVGDIVKIQRGMVDKFYLCVGAGFDEIFPDGEVENNEEEFKQWNEIKRKVREEQKK